ncbi:hypothetical protein NF212_25320 (plasmid) [Parasalinivibrio latis]|uniref:hypothetical protein n=1 Tax=Parasalinivibrio latis TaxID=2952610 RepID=UPI0030E516FE
MAKKYNNAAQFGQRAREVTDVWWQLGLLITFALFVLTVFAVRFVLTIQMQDGSPFAEALSMFLVLKWGIAVAPGLMTIGAGWMTLRAYIEQNYVI